jgi:hypothetical protein
MGYEYIIVFGNYKQSYSEHFNRPLDDMELVPSFLLALCCAKAVRPAESGTYDRKDGR